MLGGVPARPEAPGATPTPPQPPPWIRPALHCIAVHESGDGRASRNIYGMLAGWTVAGGMGRPEDASRAEQTYRAWVLYRWSLRRYGDGWLPWSTRYACGL